MEERIGNCNDVEELQALIVPGLDQRVYDLIQSRLFDLVGQDYRTALEQTIATTDDIDTLNSIIDEDDWSTNVSHLAFQRILHLAKLDNIPADDGGINPVPLDMEGGNHPAAVDEGALTSSEGRKRPLEEPWEESPMREDDREGEPSTSEPFNISHYYELESINTRHVKKYQATAADYRLRLRNLDEIALDALPTLSAVIDDVLRSLGDGIRPKDMVRIILQAPGLDKPIALPFIKKDDLTVDRFMARVEHILQSKKDVKLGSDMDVNVVHMRMPEGGKRNEKILKTWEEKKKDWGCIIQINNRSDTMCLARAIVTGQAKHELKSTNYLWRRIRDGRKQQSTRALVLHGKAKVPLEACGLEQVDAFQKAVPHYQLCVVSKEHLNKIIFKGPDKPRGIYLLYNDGHFDLIASMAAYRNRSYWCHDCKTGYDDKGRHRCVNGCKACYSGNCLTTDGVNDWVYCADCKRHFKSPACFNNHKRPGTSVAKFGTVCKQYFKCEKCDRVVNKHLLKRGQRHDCTDVWCRICKDNFPAGHKCYIKPKVVNFKGKKEKPFCYIFFDVESQQETGIYKPNLCVVQKTCETCDPRPREEPCDLCGVEKQKVFKGEKCMEEFCLWLFKEEKHHRAKCIAHNLKGYDGYFILQFLYDNGVKPDIVMNGAKIMSIFVPGPGITFKDSLNFPPWLSLYSRKLSALRSCARDTFRISSTLKRTKATKELFRRPNFSIPTACPRRGKKSF